MDNDTPQLLQLVLTSGAGVCPWIHLHILTGRYRCLSTYTFIRSHTYIFTCTHMCSSVLIKGMPYFCGIHRHSSVRQWAVSVFMFYLTELRMPSLSRKTTNIIGNQSNFGLQTHLATNYSICALLDTCIHNNLSTII